MDTRTGIWITPESLQRAAIAAGLSPQQVPVLWGELARTGAPTGRQGRIDAPQVAWYVGGVVSLLAMSVFLGTGWDQYGDAAGLLISLGYLAFFVLAAVVLLGLGKPGLRTPGGLMATVAVGLVPLVVYAVQETLDLWPSRTPGEYRDFYEWVSSTWCAMELLTILAGFVAWRLVRFPFLLVPVTVTTWFLAMDVTGLVGEGDGAGLAHALVSALVGVAALSVGLLFDLRRLPAEAFWMHLAGLLSLWWAVSARFFDSGGAAMAVTGLLGVAALAAAVPLKRRVYLVFGGIWVFEALAYLAFEVFGSSLLFPIALAGLGVGIVALGIGLDVARRRAGQGQPAPALRPDPGGVRSGTW